MTNYSQLRVCFHRFFDTFFAVPLPRTRSQQVSIEAGITYQRSLYHGVLIFSGPRYCRNFQSSAGGEGDVCRLALLNNSSHLMVDYVVTDMEVVVNSAINNCNVDIDIVTIGPGRC